VYRMARQTFDQRGSIAFSLHDPLAVAVVGHPELVRTTPSRIDVTLDGPERGQTVAHDGGTVRVAREVDVAAFGAWFQSVLGFDHPITRPVPGPWSG